MSPSGAELLRQVKSQIEEVDPSEVNELISEGVTIVDVRGSEEFATGHLPGAKSIPRGHLEARIEGAAPDRSARPICRNYSPACRAPRGLPESRISRSLGKVGHDHAGLCAHHGGLQ